MCPAYVFYLVAFAREVAPKPSSTLRYLRVIFACCTPNELRLATQVRRSGEHRDLGHGSEGACLAGDTSKREPYPLTVNLSVLPRMCPDDATLSTRCSSETLFQFSLVVFSRAAFCTLLHTTGHFFV